MRIYNTIQVVHLFDAKMLKEKWKRTWARIGQVEDYTPDVFVRCQWQKDTVSVFYLLYRWLLAGVFICGLIASMLDLGRDTSGLSYLKWPVYLTNWGYTICTIQAIMAACHVTQHYTSARDAPEKAGEMMKMKTSYKIYWVLHSIAVVGAIGITSIYWTAVYNPELNELDIVNLTVHLFNSVLMVIDLCLVAHPTKLLHCYWALSFAICYVTFNGIYFLAGGTDRQGRVYIYSILDWRRPSHAFVASLCGLVFLTLVTVIVWSISIVRRRLAIYLRRKCISKHTIDTAQLNNLPQTSLTVIRMV